MESNIDDLALPPQRPVFLKVLCMLTFICSSYIIVSSSIIYFNPSRVSRMVEESKKQINEDISRKQKKNNSPEDKVFIKKVLGGLSEISTPENLKNKAAGDVISSIFCLLGAILMWYLRRAGFILYVVGTLIGVIMPFYLFGNNFLTILGAGFTSFIGLVFIIFYAMNLKSMRW